MVAEGEGGVAAESVGVGLTAIVVEGAGSAVGGLGEAVEC